MGVARKGSAHLFKIIPLVSNAGALMTTSPTFVAEFENGDSVVVTRMTVHKPAGKLSMVRGVRLARAAYESRMKRAPPAIIAAHYEFDDEIIETYTREDLDAVS
jgi:hypothetical protein